MNTDYQLDIILGELKNLISPLPFGKMDSNIDSKTQMISTLKNYIKIHQTNLQEIGMQTSNQALFFFYLIYEVIDNFTTNYRIESIHMETYNLGMEILNIKGIFYKNHEINPLGLIVFYNHMEVLNNQYFLYQQLFPDLFSKVEAISQISPTNIEIMKVNMLLCMFHTSLTRIIVHLEKQIIRESQQEQLILSMEHVLKYIIYYLAKIPQENISDSFKTTLWELIYRIELSPNIFYGMLQFIKKLSLYIFPEKKIMQKGRMVLRVALISAEMKLQQVLIALRCFQFLNVIPICKNILAELDINEYFSSNHAGAGAMCFNGFSLKFNEFANEIILIFENNCIWKIYGSYLAGENIAKVLLAVYNLPAKKGWNGPWMELNERVINLINTIKQLNESDTFRTLFNY